MQVNQTQLVDVLHLVHVDDQATFVQVGDLQLIFQPVLTKGICALRRRWPTCNPLRLQARRVQSGRWRTLSPARAGVVLFGDVGVEPYVVKAVLKREVPGVAAQRDANLHIRVFTLSIARNSSARAFSARISTVGPW